jgi:hypothetical protein
VTLATHQPIGIRNPVLVRAKEAALLEALRRSPDGLRTPEICEATGEPVGAVADRLYRLLRLGEVERLGRVWRLPRDEADDDEPAELEQAKTVVAETEDPTKWVRPIGRFVRRDTSEFACRRYG